MDSQKFKLVLIGGGGHCESCIDVIEQENKFEIIGILDEKPGAVLGYPILGGDELIHTEFDDDTWFFVTIGQIKSAEVRKKIALKLIDKNVATIVSPRAYISKHASIGKGTIVMHNAVVNASAQLGEYCIINTLANIEHGATIEDYCHISTGAMINGGCKVGKESFIGSNATLGHLVELESNSIINAGSFVK